VRQSQAELRSTQANRDNAFEMIEIGDRPSEVQSRQPNFNRQTQNNSQQVVTNQPSTSASGGSKFGSGELRLCHCVSTDCLQQMSMTQLVCTIYCCGTAGFAGTCCPCYTKSLFTVAEDELGVVELLGKFQRVASPGPMLLLSPCCCEAETLRVRVSTRVKQLVVKSETKTKDNVFCVVEVSVQYQVDMREEGVDLDGPDLMVKNEVASDLSAGAGAVLSRRRRVGPSTAKAAESAKSAAYKVDNFEQLLTDQVNDIVRAKLSRVELDQAFLLRSDLQDEVMSVVGSRVQEYGYNVVKALVTNFRPDQNVVNNMNEIYTQNLKKQVAVQVAETKKMVEVILAEAESDRKELLGKGVSLMRQAYLVGMQECLDEFVKSFEDDEFVMTFEDVLYTQLLLQHFDTMKSVSQYSADVGEEPHLALSVGPEALEQMRAQLGHLGHWRTGADGPKKNRGQRSGASVKSKQPTGAAAAASGDSAGKWW